jgi:hypothetical protein
MYADGFGLALARRGYRPSSMEGQLRLMAETTLIYAHADTEMKRHALEKANSATTHSPIPAPLWHNREDIIQRLCGLKSAVNLVEAHWDRGVRSSVGWVSMVWVRLRQSVRWALST